MWVLNNFKWRASAGGFFSAHLIWSSSAQSVYMDVVLKANEMDPTPRLQGRREPSHGKKKKHHISPYRDKASLYTVCMVLQLWLYSELEQVFYLPLHHITFNIHILTHTLSMKLLTFLFFMASSLIHALWDSGDVSHFGPLKYLDSYWTDCLYFTGSSDTQSILSHRFEGDISFLAKCIFFAHPELWTKYGA